MAEKTKKYYLWVLGCQMNKADAERIEAIVANLGYQKTASENAADLLIVVACSVRQSAIDRIYGQARRWQSRRKQGKLLTVLTGCVLDQDKEKMKDSFDVILAVKDISQLPRKLLGLKAVNIRDYFHLEQKHLSRFQAYAPIMTGCNNFCSYCVVPYARGREVSRPAQEILAECRRLIKNGYKEITLLGQNVNSYKSYLLSLPEPACPVGRGEWSRSDRGGGRNKLINFPELLRMIDKIPGDWRLRFVTSHPKDLSDKLIKVMAQGQHTTPYLHLALQSGDAKILKAMNRKYTPADYLRLVKKVRKALPEIMISTDIIVGFPGETKEQFNRTIKVFKEANFDLAYIAQYSPRSGTAAAKLADKVSPAEKKKREWILNEVLKKIALANNRRLLGRTERVLVEKYKNGRCLGKTASFKTVAFAGKKSLVGKFAEVKIFSAGSWGLGGEIKEN